MFILLDSKPVAKSCRHLPPNELFSITACRQHHLASIDWSCLMNRSHFTVIALFTFFSLSLVFAEFLRTRCFCTWYITRSAKYGHQTFTSGITVRHPVTQLSRNDVRLWFKLLRGQATRAKLGSSSLHDKHIYTFGYP